MDEEAEEFTVNDVLSFDDEDPGQNAARKLDLEFFLASLTDREKAVVEGLLTDFNASEIGRALGLDLSTIRYFKQRLAMIILEHFGQDILVEIRKSPKWKNNLNANRERLSYKNLRRN